MTIAQKALALLTYYDNVSLNEDPFGGMRIRCQRGLDDHSYQGVTRGAAIGMAYQHIIKTRNRRS